MHRRRCARAAGVSAVCERLNVVAGRCCAVCITHSNAGLRDGSRHLISTGKAGAGKLPAGAVSSLRICLSLVPLRQHYLSVSEDVAPNSLGAVNHRSA